MKESFNLKNPHKLSEYLKITLSQLFYNTIKVDIHCDIWVNYVKE